VASFFCRKNKEFIKKYLNADEIITYSHFLPRIDLLPNKFWLQNKTLTFVTGTPKLEKQIRKIKPMIHVFGHSHINCDKIFDGIRYTQNALGHPREQNAVWRSLEGAYEPKLLYSKII